MIWPNIKNSTNCILLCIASFRAIRCCWKNMAVIRHDSRLRVLRLGRCRSSEERGKLDRSPTRLWLTSNFSSSWKQTRSYACVCFTKIIFKATIFTVSYQIQCFVLGLVILHLLLSHFSLNLTFIFTKTTKYLEQNGKQKHNRPKNWMAKH